MNSFFRHSITSAPSSRHLMPNFPSFKVLGAKINAVSLSDVVDAIFEWIRLREQVYVVMTGAHGIIEMQDDKELLEINNNADLVTPDGIPEVVLGRLKGYKQVEKVYAVNTMKAVFRKGLQFHCKHFFYGGKPEVAEKLVRSLRQQCVGIDIVGSYSPPFRQLTDQEMSDVAKLVNDSKPDIVWCGLGCPKQERWMVTFRPLLDAPVLIGVGAGFDFLSGEKPIAPDWVVHSGLEWLFRMFSEPVRLGRRYARVVPRFIALVLLEIFGIYRRN